MEQNPKEKSKRVQIIDAQEPWAIATLEDGTVVKGKLVFTGAHLVLQEDGRTPVYNPDGSPMYKVNINQILVIEAYEQVPENTQRN